MALNEIRDIISLELFLKLHLVIDWEKLVHLRLLHIVYICMITHTHTHTHSKAKHACALSRHCEPVYATTWSQARNFQEE